MEVTFQLTPDDVAHYEQWHRKNKGCFSVPQLAIFLVVFVGFMALQFAGDRKLRMKWELFGPLEFFRHEKMALLAMLLPLVFFALFWTVLLKMPPRWRYKAMFNSPAIKGPWRVALSHEGLLSQQVTIDTLYRWPHLEGIAETATHIFVQLAPGSAIVIPKRAFADEATAQRFFETAHGYLREAKGTPPPIPHPDDRAQTP